MDFAKTGNVRIEQLRDEINQAAQAIGFVLPVQTIQWIPGEQVIRFTNAVDGVDAQIDVEALVLQYQTQVQNIVNSHEPSNVYFLSEIKDAYLSSLAGIRQQIIDAVVALEGVSITDMTTGQLKILLLALAYESGAIDPETLTIRHPKDWIG